MKTASFAYSLLAGLMFTALAPRAQSAPAPFEAAAARSEVLDYHATSPQIVGSATADSLTYSYQLNDGSNPSSTRIIHFTRAGNTYTKAWDAQLALARLVGMTTDGSNFYIVSAVSEDLSAETNTNGFRVDTLIMQKLDKQGKLLWQRNLNDPAYLGDSTSGAIYSPLKAGTGAVAYGAGRVIVALATNTLPDGAFRHQRALYFAVGENGEAYKAASETSWRHSFDQRLLFDGKDFVFTDLGDAGSFMPGAGIAVRKIRPNAAGAEFVCDAENREGTYIYMRQGETAAAKNWGFTSIGGLELGAQGYLALFTSETNNPTVMRDGGAEPIKEPRNLAFVHVTPNFETVKEGNWNGGQVCGNTVIQDLPISTTINNSVVDSNGPSAKFSRPDMPEKTFTQRGIVWLTNLPAGVSAERSKLIKLDNGRFIAVWEEWNYSGSQLNYSKTKGIIINEQGQIIAGPTTLNARLNPSGADRAFVLDGKAAWIIGEAGEFKLYTVDTNLSLSSTVLDTSGIPQPSVFTDHLSAGDKLKPGDKLQSNNGRYNLVYQTDGSLALYGDSNSMWNTGILGSPGYAIMQTDGNFAIYAPNGTFQWNTGTTTPGSRLVLQDNGNLVIISPSGNQLWSSNTAQTSRDSLKEGDKLTPGQKLESSNGRYTLVYQTDGDLVLYTGSTALWASGTKGKPAGYAVMQTDGNFAIYGPDGSYQWDVGTVNPGSWIVLESNGNLVIYTKDGTALWSSNTAQS